MPLGIGEFLGAAFALESVESIGLSTLRVRFAQDPKVVSKTAVDDALRPANYILSGPSRDYVTSVKAVPGDPQGVDLHLAGPITGGEWTLAVTSIKSDTGFALSEPTSLTFSVAHAAEEPDPASGGAVNADVWDILRKHLNPSLSGPGWDAIIEALSTGDQLNWDNARLAFDQLFISTASGNYLERRAADQGIRKPAGMAMSDDVFRQLVIIERTKQLTQDAILAVLEVFYGREALRATVTAGASEPYALEDGDTFRLLVDDRDDISVTFNATDFALIGEASAVEVAAVITRALRIRRSQALAAVVTDNEAATNTVRIYSGERGIGSSIKVIGGRAQGALQFPDPLFVTSGVSPFAVWNITNSPTTAGNMRFTLTSGIYDLSIVRGGDLVYVYGAEFVPANVGTFEIQAVDVTYAGGLPVQWFEVVNPFGSPQAAVSQTLFSDLGIVRPQARTIYDEPRHVVVVQSGPSIDITIPATTQVVTRKPMQAAYVQTQDAIVVTSLIRSNGIVTATTASPHGLAPGGRVDIDGARATVVVPAVDPGAPSPEPIFAGAPTGGSTDSSLRSTASETGVFQGVDHRVLTLTNGTLLIVGGRNGASRLPNPVLFRIMSATIWADSWLRWATYQWQELTDFTTLGSGYASGRRAFGASVLDDGRILLTGGTNVDSDDPLFATNVTGVNLGTNGVTLGASTGDLPEARAHHAQCGSNISGGWTTDILTPDAKTYKLGVNASAWTRLADLFHPRMRHEMVRLPVTEVGVPGQLMAIGGTGLGGNILNACERFIDEESWKATGSMTDARYHFGCVSLPDGRVIVIGGMGEVPLASCEIYSPDSHLWLPLPSMSTPRVSPVALYLQYKNAVLVTGGGVGTIEMLDLKTMTWSTLVATLATGLAGSVGAVTGTSLVLVAGGVNPGGAALKKNYIIIPGQDVFSRGGLDGEMLIDSVPTGTSFTYSTLAGGYDAYSVATAGITATPVAAPAGPTGVLGPFLFDPTDGAAVTGTEAVLVSGFGIGRHYSIATFDDVSAFPDETGYLAFEFGTGSSVYPVKYLGKLGTTQLILDATFAFPRDVAAGATTTLLSGRSPFLPSRSAQLGGFYVTGSAAGRLAAQEVLTDTIAAGVTARVTVVYPSDIGLGNSGDAVSGVTKLTDAVVVWGGDSIDAEVAAARKQS